ncbi:hypothetical protein diail_10651 [Diaporthe ilicicola]|nr:hypothetical protein diail_10651 [Diaporthe ilicicola]
MEHSYTPQGEAQPMADDLSRMRKLSQNAARLVRKMASNVPSTPFESPDQATAILAPTGENGTGQLQAYPLPGFALPPAYPLLTKHQYDNTLRCDKCGGGSDFGWFYRCCHDTETRLYESIRDGNTEHFDEIGEMFSHQMKRPDRGPAARSDKLSLLDELSPEQVKSLSAPQLAALLRQREHANDQAITDHFGFLGPASYDRPFLKSEIHECKQTLCPACGKGMMGEEVSFLSLNGIVEGDIPPTAALGFGFRKHGRMIADANVVRDIGLRKAPKNKHQASETTRSEGNNAEERVEPKVKDEGETSLVTSTEAPLTPSNTFLNMADSSDDLLELYTDGSSVEVAQDDAKA